MGGLNETLLPGDQKGGNFSLTRAWAFGQALGSCGVVDNHALVWRYTWHRHFRVISISKVHDTGVANMQWIMIFQKII